MENNDTEETSKVARSEALRWPEDLTVAFVQEYVSHECLWNNNLPSYKNQQEKLEAYKALVEAMHLPDFGVDECKSKIKNLRSTYSQELHKIRRSRDEGRPYKPILKWFPIMHNSLKCVQLKNNMSQIEIDTKDDCPSDLSDHSDVQILFVEPETKSKKRTRTKKIKKTKKRKSRTPSPVSEYEENINYINEDDIGDDNLHELVEDEFDIFGKFISVQLRNMPLKLALEAQKQLQSCLTEFRLSNT